MKVLLYPTINGLLFLDEKDELIHTLWKNISIAELAENDVSSDIGDGDNKVADAAADSSEVGQGSD